MASESRPILVARSEASNICRANALSLTFLFIEHLSLSASLSCWLTRLSWPLCLSSESLSPGRWFRTGSVRGESLPLAGEREKRAEKELRPRAARQEILKCLSLSLLLLFIFLTG